MRRFLNLKEELKMQNNIQVFENSEFGKLGVLMLNDKPYLPATDCAKILGYANTNDAIKRHCRGVVKHDLPSASGVQSYNFIPEGDLYRLIIRSKLPAAERFENGFLMRFFPLSANTAHI